MRDPEAMEHGEPEPGQTSAEEVTIIDAIRQRLQRSPGIRHLKEIAAVHSLLTTSGPDEDEMSAPAVTQPVHEEEKRGKITRLTRRQLLAAQALRDGRPLPHD